MIFKNILDAFALNFDDYAIRNFGTGLINHTWKLQSKTTGNAYILQQVNQTVFNHPEYISYNLSLIKMYLQQHYPDYLFIAPVKTAAHADYYENEAHHFYRLFPFLSNSHSIDVVHTPQQAFEAARQFALFTRLLSGFDASLLKITLPHFHDLSFRFKNFTEALKWGNQERVREAEFSISYLKKHEYIVTTYEKIKHLPRFKLRVTHHDTKISNVLFDAHDKGLCVIDLDTVMPGYFISDVGDMMRTYLSSANEEETDFSKICVREDFFSAIVQGYLSEMKDELTVIEKEYFVYAAKFLIYMQALRFLTDYISEDIYYGARYEGHNLTRADNQIKLLKEIIRKEKHLLQIVKTCLKQTKAAQEFPRSFEAIKRSES